MTSESESDSLAAASPRRREGAGGEEAAFESLRAHAAATLRGRAASIAARWVIQAHNVAPIDASIGTEAMAEAVLESLAAAVSGDGAATGALTERGVALGEEAVGRELPLFHVLRALDLLAAMAMYEIELAAATLDSPRAGAATGVRLSRHTQHQISQLVLAVTKGYARGTQDVLRERFRHLRHDLRNPLGTIRSVLALMDDESVPADARTNPRLRAMASRNARALEDMIGARLSDAEASAPIVRRQLVSLRAVACAVRRELRADAASRGVDVQVAARGPRVHADAAALELMLLELVRAALHESADRDELGVEFGAPRDSTASIRLRRRSGRPAIADVEAQIALQALVRRLGAHLETNVDATLVVPATRASDEPRATAAAAVVAGDAAATPASELRLRETRDDVGSSGERDHRQSSG